MEVDFTARVFEWRGPSPYVFAALSAEAVDAVRVVAAGASYGWGCIPVTAAIGDTVWQTSLIPKDGGYLLPLRSSVRQSRGIGLGDEVAVQLQFDA